MKRITEMDVLELQETFSDTIPPGARLVKDAELASFAPEFAGLRKALETFSGSSVNPTKANLGDFDCVVLFYEGPTGYQGFFMHNRTGRFAISTIAQWATNNYWVVCAELSKLAAGHNIGG